MKELEHVRHINKAAKGFVSRVVDFLKEYSVIGVALGVIVAQASKDFVDAVVKGVVMPLVYLLLPGENVSDIIVNFKGAQLNIGWMISSFLTLSIIVLLLYLVFRRLVKLKIIRKD